jgi:hypothetical protein
MPTPIFDQKALAPLIKQALVEQLQQAPTGAPPSKGKPVGKAPYLVHAAGNLADGLSSYAASKQGGQERNPLLPNNGAAILAIKAASTIPEALLIRLLAKHGHEKIAKALGYGLGGAGMAATIGNLRVKRPADATDLVDHGPDGTGVVRVWNP